MVPKQYYLLLWSKVLCNETNMVHREENEEGLCTPALQEGCLTSEPLITSPLFIQSKNKMGRARCKYGAELYTSMSHTM